ncbi:hypothetical protein [Ectothiorhodospira shaposhnikovii]|uniref:hypothetical protein n=1 Tax=Ectothiorhodospira shaposhnikovii TaxID=1054 RepID=UPI0039A0D607
MPLSWLRKLPWMPTLWLALCLPSVVQGADLLDRFNWARVPDAELAEQRGGLMHRGGFELTLGLERMTAVNGEVVAHTVLRDSAGSRAALDVLGGIHITTGLNGLSVEQLTGSGWATVIQNTLNEQLIVNHTIMNIGLTGLDLSRLELQRVLDAGLIQGLRSY